MQVVLAVDHPLLLEAGVAEGRLELPADRREAVAAFCEAAAAEAGGAEAVAAPQGVPTGWHAVNPVTNGLVRRRSTAETTNPLHG